MAPLPDSQFVGVCMCVFEMHQSDSTVRVDAQPRCVCVGSHPESDSCIGIISVRVSNLMQITLRVNRLLSRQRKWSTCCITVTIVKEVDVACPISLQPRLR
jgi:hypothetical protein